MKAIRIETLAIGDELLSGVTADTNSGFVARQCLAVGAKLQSITVVPDDDAAIEAALVEAERRCDVLLVFGGLGPTSDDRTVDVVSRWLGSKPALHGPSRVKLEQRFTERGLAINESVLRQVRYPECAEPLENDMGLAPGFRLTRGSTRIFFFPGVPWEMESIFTRWALPEIRALAGRSGYPTVAKTWACVGVGEGQLAQLLAPFEAKLSSAGTVGYRSVGFPENHVTLYWRGSDNEVERVAAQSTLKEMLRPWCFSDDGRTLEEVCVALMTEKKKSVAFAESATAGGISALLATVPGASPVLWGGCSVYRRESKRALLNVFPKTEEAAVSEETSAALAENLLQQGLFDVSVALTGYLGPGGGTEKDPDGTIYIALRERRGVSIDKRFFQPQRSRRLARRAAEMRALEVLWRWLRGEK